MYAYAGIGLKIYMLQMRHRRLTMASISDNYIKIGSDAVVRSA